jgi:hypothetical protein
MELQDFSKFYNSPRGSQGETCGSFSSITQSMTLSSISVVGMLYYNSSVHNNCNIAAALNPYIQSYWELYNHFETPCTRKQSRHKTQTISTQTIRLTKYKSSSNSIISVIRCSFIGLEDDSVYEP